MGLDFVSQPELPIFLLHEQILPLSDLHFCVLEVSVDFLSPHFRVEETLLHHSYVLVERAEVVGEHLEFLVEVGDGVFGLGDLHLERGDVSALLCLDVEQKVDLGLHLVFLVLELVSKHLQLLVGELLFGELLSEHGSVFSLSFKLKL